MGSTRKGEFGYSLIIAIFAIAIFSIFLLLAKPLWETTIQRDLEEELIFRGKQYVRAIELFVKEKRIYPKDLEILESEKFIRKLYKDPMTESGTWNYIMLDFSGGRRSLLLVPEEMVPAYVTRANIIGVASTSPMEGFREYRGKRLYLEWAFYIGGKDEEDMPDIRYVGE